MSWRTALVVLGVSIGVLGWAGMPAAPVPAASSASPPVLQPDALIARDRRLLNDLAAGLLDVRLQPLFEAYHAGVPEFAAWAYRWRTSYTLLRQGVVELARRPFAGAEDERPVGEVWAELIAARFDELVVQPAGGVEALRELEARWLEELEPRMAAVLAETAQTYQLLQGDVARPPDATVAPLAMVPVLPLFEDLSATTDPVTRRVVRPLLARLTLRPSVAAGVSMVGERIGGNVSWLAEYPMIGSVTGQFSTVGAFLGLDYLLNRADAALNEEALAADLHRVVDSAHAAMRAEWLEAARAGIEQRLAPLQAALSGPAAP